MVPYLLIYLGLVLSLGLAEVLTQEDFLALLGGIWHIRNFLSFFTIQSQLIPELNLSL